MRLTRSTTSALALVALSLGCADPVPDASRFAGPMDVPVLSMGEASGHFTAAPLQGENERPNPVESQGAGSAQFWLSEDGTTMRYQLNVANLENVIQSHIHVTAAPDLPGPVAVFLFGPVPGGVTVRGKIAEGEFTAADLRAQPIAGFDGTMSELVRFIREGRAYVNVHTAAFPGGEILGAVR